MVHSLLSLWTVWRLELAQGTGNIVPVTIFMAVHKMAILFLPDCAGWCQAELLHAVMVSSILIEEVDFSTFKHAEYILDVQ